MRRGHVRAAVPAKPYELERLRDPATAAAYLSIAARDEDPAAFLQALKHVTDATGGIAKIAARTGLNRQQLYRALSKDGKGGRRRATGRVRNCNRPARMANDLTAFGAVDLSPRG